MGEKGARERGRRDRLDESAVELGQGLCAIWGSGQAGRSRGGLRRPEAVRHCYEPDMVNRVVSFHEGRSNAPAQELNGRI